MATEGIPRVGRKQRWDSLERTAADRAWPASGIWLGRRNQPPRGFETGDGYHLWYTEQAKGHSWIGYATSANGVTWNRISDKPVLSAEKPLEKVVVMCPHVLWDAEMKLFRMWYSGGEQGEPNSIGYANSLMD